MEYVGDFDHQPPTHLLDGGGAWRFTKTQQIDLHVGVGLNRSSPALNGVPAAQYYTHFDHLHPSSGPDGTPIAFYEALRDDVVLANRPVGWNEEHGGVWVIAGYPKVLETKHNTKAFSDENVTFPSYGTSKPLMLAGQNDPAHKRARCPSRRRYSREDRSPLDA